MQAQMIIGFFRYDPCELYTEDETLCVKFPRSDRVIRIASITRVVLSDIRDGTSRLEITAGSGQYEFVLTDIPSRENAAEMLYGLTKKSTVLELRAREG